MSLTVILGGARSGKSAFAVEYATNQNREVCYIATASASDQDMADRIQKHRSERPAKWTTIEEQFDLEAALKAARGQFVIVDCLTLWTSNLMFQGLHDDEIDTIATNTAAVAAARNVATLAISNEVGMGVHPDTSLGRRYRDVLGRVNQRWVAASESSLLLVAGKAIELHDPAEILIERSTP
jgi:adenosylcobinamide kinase/adenosylcobinamide-phosphate guanylyltransferase